MIPENIIIEIKQEIAYFRERANTTSIETDAIRYSATAHGLQLALDKWSEETNNATNE